MDIHFYIQGGVSPVMRCIYSETHFLDLGIDQKEWEGFYEKAIFTFKMNR